MLLDLVRQDTELRARGAELHGACPWCGGRDRFVVFPASDRYWCRRCHRGGDAVQYLRDRDGLGFRAACAELGRATGGPGRAPGAAPRAADPPSAAWQARARLVRERAEAVLWSRDGAPALRYLRERRGLADATIRRWGLGYVPRDLDEAPGRWGIEQWTTPAGRPGRVYLPHGVLIPALVGGALWYAKVRRPRLTAGGEPDELARYVGGARRVEKYALAKGSRRALFGADTLAGHDVALLVEGEFDAMVVEQEAGDLVGVCTMGSASTPVAGDWLVDLAGVRRVLVVQDNDGAGAGAAHRIAALSARTRIGRLPAGVKDPTALHVAGGDLRSWVQYQVERHDGDRGGDVADHRALLELVLDLADARGWPALGEPLNVAVGVTSWDAWTDRASAVELAEALAQLRDQAGEARP